MSSQVDSSSTSISANAAVPTGLVSRATSTESSLVLAGIHWDEYLSLRQKPENRHVRMTYQDGSLEFMTLSSFHELISLIIHDFILEWRVAKDIPAMPTGSMTLKLKSTQSGLEGDQSYYIQNYEAVKGQRVIDLETSPPPDLVIEVEHSRNAISKMDIYRDLNVPEIWRWCEEKVSVFRLVEGVYVQQPNSTALPGFPFDLLAAGLAKRFDSNETELIKSFRQAINKL